jgi:hypothetical protein
MARDVDRNLTPEHGELIPLVGDDGLRVTIKLRHRRLSEYVRLSCEIKGAPRAEKVESLGCWFIAGWAGLRHDGRSVPFSRQGLAALLAVRHDLAADLLHAINERLPDQEMVAEWCDAQAQDQECEE